MDIYKKIFEFVGSTYQPKENRDKLFETLKIYMYTVSKMQDIKKNIDELSLLMRQNDIFEIITNIDKDVYEDYFYINELKLFNKENKEILNQELILKINDYIDDDISYYIKDKFQNKSIIINLDNINEMFIGVIKEKELNIYNEIEHYEKNLLNESININIDNKKMKNNKI